MTHRITEAMDRHCSWSYKIKMKKKNKQEMKTYRIFSDHHLLLFPQGWGGSAALVLQSLGLGGIYLRPCLAGLSFSF